MRRTLYLALSFIIWILLTWPFADGTIDLQIVIVGLVVSAVVAVLFHEILPREHGIFISPTRAFWFLLYVPVFFYYMVRANFDVVYRALHPQMPIKPGIVKIKTALKTDSGLTALANSITLTPGTLTVDLTGDGYLYVHWINVKSDDVEQATAHIARRFEWFIAKIFE
ncbi:MAG TPA: Na+/H+ antiporter subunit E [Phycisphaerales bacterium]|nr:Na+/H+ antiporter subunit E [Phycisphaerales bacterium]